MTASKIEWTATRNADGTLTPGLNPQCGGKTISGITAENRRGSQAGRPKAKINPVAVSKQPQRPSTIVPATSDVDEWIRLHGVTRCPTVALAFTTATISHADQAEYDAYCEAQQARRAARTRKEKQNDFAKGVRG